MIGKSLRGKVMEVTLFRSSVVLARISDTSCTIVTMIAIVWFVNLQL